MRCKRLAAITVVAAALKRRAGEVFCFCASSVDEETVSSPLTFSVGADVCDVCLLRGVPCDVCLLRGVRACRGVFSFDLLSTEPFVGLELAVGVLDLSFDDLGLALGVFDRFEDLEVSDARLVSLPGLRDGVSSKPHETARLIEGEFEGTSSESRKRDDKEAGNERLGVFNFLDLEEVLADETPLRRLCDRSGAFVSTVKSFIDVLVS